MTGKQKLIRENQELCIDIMFKTDKIMHIIIKYVDL